MKAIITQSISGINVNIKPIIVVFTLLFIFFMSALIVVRQQCIHESYKISSLTTEMDKKNLEYEKLSKQYSNILRRENLTKQAIEMDFVFPVGGKVFYVQR